MEILTFGVGERLRICASALASGYVGDCRVVVLPIPTSRDKKTVTGTSTPLEDILCEVRCGTVVAGYGIPDSLGREIEDRGGVIYDALLDEEFLRENAELTALGTLGYILTELGRAPSDLKVGIVGYGRIGSAMARLLLFLGAYVRIYSGSSATLSTLSSLGIESRDYRTDTDFSGLDLLINTAPSAIVTKRSAASLSGAALIDLASGKYLDGIDGVVKLPSVPEVSFPVSAGKIYARCIGRHICDLASPTKN